MLMGALASGGRLGAAMIPQCGDARLLSGLLVYNACMLRGPVVCGVTEGREEAERKDNIEYYSKKRTVFRTAAGTEDRVVVPGSLAPSGGARSPVIPSCF